MIRAEGQARLRALMVKRNGLPIPKYTAFRLAGWNDANQCDELARVTSLWPDLYETDSGLIGLNLDCYDSGLTQATAPDVMAPMGVAT